jgi:peptidoglycan-N-acetylglucosamine deacetylase
MASVTRRFARAGLNRVRALPWARAFPPRRLKDFRPRGAGGRERSIALTFDDGPDPAVTPRILSSLSDEGVQATFFMCGLAAERHPDLVRAVSSEGHIIGGHTWHHLDIRGFCDDAWETEVDRTHRLLAAMTGQRVRYFRPPYMAYDATALRRLRERDILPVHASVSGDDWRTPDPHAIAQKIARELQPGSIVLLHDACGDLLNPEGELPAGVLRSREATATAVPMVIAAARAAGLECVTLP